MVEHKDSEIELVASQYPAIAEKMRTIRESHAALLEALEEMTAFDVSPTFDAKGSYSQRKSEEWHALQAKARAAIAQARGERTGPRARSTATRGSSSFPAASAPRAGRRAGRRRPRARGSIWRRRGRRRAALLLALERSPQELIDLGELKARVARQLGLRLRQELTDRHPCVEGGGFKALRVERLGHFSSLSTGTFSAFASFLSRESGGSCRPISRRAR